MKDFNCNLLLVEGARDMGGSVRCLSSYMKFLDRDRFNPLVVCLFSGRHTDFLNEACKVKVICCNFSKQGSYGDRFIRSGKRRLILIFGEGKIFRFISLLRRILLEIILIVKLLFIIRRNRIALMHLNNGLSIHWAGIIAARLNHIPCVCHVRSFERLSSISRYLSRIVNQFIFISEAIKANYIEQGVSAEKCVIVYDGMECCNNSDRKIDYTDIKHKLNIDFDLPVVGTIGRLVECKGQKFLIEAAAKVIRHVSKIKFLIVGDIDSGDKLGHSYQKELKNLVKKLNITEYVIFTGFHSDVQNLIAIMDMFVLPSLEEGFGMVLLEAMLIGKPIVATNVGGIPEMIEDGKTGLLVPPEDAEALAQAINRLLKDKNLAESLAQNACQKAREKFDIRKTIEKIQSIYERLLLI